MSGRKFAPRMSDDLSKICAEVSFKLWMVREAACNVTYNTKKKHIEKVILVSKFLKTITCDRSRSWSVAASCLDAVANVVWMKEFRFFHSWAFRSPVETMAIFRNTIYLNTAPDLHNFICKRDFWILGTDVGIGNNMAAGSAWAGIILE